MREKTMKSLNKYIDHTLLKQDSVTSQIEKLCKEAKENDFATVCVNPCWISTCKQLLSGSDVQVCTVIGFPLGAMTSESKAFEASNAIELGADEIDMVINIGALKDKQDAQVLHDLQLVRQACANHVLKVILEVCLLTEEEIVRACQLCVEAKVDFVKTSTGFSTHGATIESVSLMKQTVKGQCQVKAAGGVRSSEEFLAMIQAGADRIGTSSGVALVNGQKVKSQY